MDDKDRKKKVCSCCLKVQDKDNHSKCSNCRIAVYCDAKCQKEHWPIHKFICKDSNDDDDDLKLFKKCNACLVQSDWARGEKLFQKLLKRMQKTNNKEMEFEGIHGLAQCAQEMGKIELAIQLYRGVLEKRRLFYGDEDHHYVLNSETNLCQALNRNHKFEETVPMLKLTLQRKRRVLGLDHKDTLTCKQALCVALLGLRKFNDAKEFEADISVQSNDTYRNIIDIQNKAHVFLQKDEYSKAKPILRKGLSLCLNGYGINHTITAAFHHNLGICLRHLSELEESESVLRSSLKVRRVRLFNSQELYLTVFELGITLSMRGRLSEAENLINEFIDNDTIDTSNSVNVNIAKKTLADIYVKRKEYDRAESLLIATIEKLHNECDINPDPFFPWKKKNGKEASSSSSSSQSEHTKACCLFLKSMGIMMLNSRADGIQLVDCLQNVYELQGKFDKVNELLSWLGLDSFDHMKMFDAIINKS